MNNVNERIPDFRSFLGHELYKLYFKMASSCIELRSDIPNARNYLQQCNLLIREHKIFNNGAIEAKF